MKDEKQREYYRLAYPQMQRPTLAMGLDEYEVEDVSEYGIKLKIQDELDFILDDQVMATIIFPDGREFDLSGYIVRLEHGFAGLRLLTPLPNSLIRSQAMSVLFTPQEH